VGSGFSLNSNYGCSLIEESNSEHDDDVHESLRWNEDLITPLLVFCTHREIFRSTSYYYRLCECTRINLVEVGLRIIGIWLGWQAGY
jgi:hypothetical protein